MEALEDQDIKRGIDFNNRVIRGRLARKLQKSFEWWSGKGFSENTSILLFTVFIINILLVYPIYLIDVTPAYSSSALLSLADLLQRTGLLGKDQFFSFITIFAVAFAPVSFYLFVWRIALRHELTAFLATLLFILPNPFIKQYFPVVGTILMGDGAHAFAFSFIPFLLIFAQKFITDEKKEYGIFAAAGSAIVSIISPFSFFNLLIMLTVLTISEGFLGEMRIKLGRFFSIITSALGLSLFWYFPNFFSKIVLLEHVSQTFQKFWSILPLAIPAIPILGTLAFLIFDRRQKLRPILVGSLLFLIYFSLYLASKSLNITGIFTPERYLLELSFATSYFFALIIVLLSEFLIRNFILKIKQKSLSYVYIILFSAFSLFSIVGGFINALIARGELNNQAVSTQYNTGIGGIYHQGFDFGSLIEISASLISLGLLIHFIIILGKISLYKLKPAISHS